MCQQRSVGRRSPAAAHDVSDGLVGGDLVGGEADLTAARDALAVGNEGGHGGALAGQQRAPEVLVPQRRGGPGSLARRRPYRLAARRRAGLLSRRAAQRLVLLCNDSVDVMLLVFRGRADLATAAPVRWRVARPGTDRIKRIFLTEVLHVRYLMLG